MHVKATKLLNMPTIPCIAVDTLTASELKLLRIATNRLGENYGWRFNDLKLELEELIIDDAPIEVSGFELTKIYVIIEVAKLPPFELGPLVLETEQTPAAQSGDVFVMGPHRVNCGDAQDATTMCRLMRDDTGRIDKLSAKRNA